MIKSVTLILLFAGLTPLRAQEEEEVRPDTIYYFPPVVVSPAQALERRSPVTFTNLSRQQIAERYSAQDVPVLLSELPSMTFYSENGNGIGYNYVKLRGFDQRRLSVMINGVPQNDPEDHNVYWIDFPDLMASAENIQVQRGAGSSFYGPPAIGGSINLITNPFDRQPGVRLETSFGFQEFGDSTAGLVLNTRKFQATVNSGLVGGKYLINARLGRIMSDGYRAGSWVEMDSYFLGAVRFDNSLTTRLHLYGGPIRDALAYIGLPRSSNADLKLRRENFSYWEFDSGGSAIGYRVPQKPGAIEEFSQPHYELINDWKISPAVTLHSTLFYFQGEGYFIYDGDWIAYPDANGNPTPSILWFRNVVGYDSTFGASVFPSLLIRGYVQNRQWGWLPNVEIAHQRGTLILGAEVRQHRSLHYGAIEYASQLPLSYDPGFRLYQYNGRKDIASLYGRETYALDGKATLTADLQLTWNRYGIENERYLGNAFSYAYLFANPRIGINDNVDSAWNLYCSLAYTSREPRLRNLYAAEDSYFGATPQFAADTLGGRVRYDFSRPIAQPEQLLDIELGAGMRSARAQFTANLFWMEFTNELVNSGQIDIFGQPVTGNAERTRHLGIEVDGSVALGAGWMVSGNCSLSRNRLVRHREYVPTAGGNGYEQVSLDGNPIDGFPDVLANVRLTYRGGGVSASVLGKYVGGMYTDNFHTEANRNDPFEVFNAELLWQLPRFADSELTLRAELRNVFDRLYFNGGQGKEFFPAAERNLLLGVAANF
jgi:iron complex outermembrane receptor protein